MKYHVMLDDTTLSTHKSRELAEKALRRWMRKHNAQRRARNARLRWVDPKLTQASGIYYVRHR